MTYECSNCERRIKGIPGMGFTPDGEGWHYSYEEEGWYCDRCYKGNCDCGNECIKPYCVFKDDQWFCASDCNELRF